jgi:hypothetical protein
MAKYIFNYAEKYAVWETHGYRCFWCGQPLEIRHVTVDHVIPEHLEEKPDKLNWIKEHYSLPEGFNVNSFENWVPCHSNCNSKKSVTVYVSSPAFIAVLDAVGKKGIESRRRYNTLIQARDRSKVITGILVDLEKGNISEDDLISLLRTTNNTAPIVQADEHGQLFIHVSKQWKIISEPTNDVVMVSDGVRAGLTPTIKDPHSSWRCPYCTSYGPWNGVICMNCGQKSDPFD